MPDIANLPAIAALFDYAAAAPATDPGEGYWADIETAFGCGERAAQYEAATKIRAALSALGLMTPNGVELCPGCSQPAASSDHDPDCEHADDADRITIPETAPRVITPNDLSPESRTDAIQAIVIGADQMRYTSGGGVEFLVGGEPIDPRGIADTTVLHIAGDQEWSVGQQRAAETQGWAIVTRSNERDLIVITLDGERFLTSAEAGEHVAEGARGGHAFSDDYVALCRAALALVEASAANPDDDVADTPALPSTPPSDASALARAARAAGWDIVYDDEQDVYAAAAPEGATVTFGDWQRLADVPAGCIYEWRFAATMETQPGLWLNVPTGDAGCQCRIATLTPALPSDSEALPSRSDAQIIEQAEDLARRMATEVMGYDLGAVSIPLRTMTDPRMRMCWQMACLAIEELQATDVTNALAGIGE